jgi:GT2 family glycosyltransferase
VFSFCYYGANLGVGAFMFMRRESFEAVGGFDEQYFAGEEMYLTLALKKLGRFTILSEPIITSARKVRMHSGLHVFRQWAGMMLGGQTGLRTRDRLGLWYDGKREQRS